jgi:hypothetical protein
MMNGMYEASSDRSAIAVLGRRATAEKVERLRQAGTIGLDEATLVSRSGGRFADPQGRLWQPDPQLDHDPGCAFAAREREVVWFKPANPSSVAELDRHEAHRAVDDGVGVAGL